MRKLVGNLVGNLAKPRILGHLGPCDEAEL